MSNSPRAIVVDRVSKQFRLPHEQMHTLKERVLHPLRQPTFDAFPALRNVSFDVGRGEFFGIVGRNGSGKSTLLKCLAGIYRADEGEIYVDGQMSTFIELGVGFNPDLPARDNVMINATMMGLSTKEARRRFDGIIDFAELHEFVDLKLKNYSSGMMVRLAFSVAIQVDAEILLIDEVLAVGDASFQQKCFDEFARIRKSGATVLLVTHDMGSVERFCDRAILLEHGRVVDLGETSRIGSKYFELNFSAEAREAEHQAGRAAADEELTRPEEVAEVAEVADAGAEAQPPAPEVAEDGAAEASEPTRFGNGKAHITEGWFEDAEGKRSKLIWAGQQVAFCFRVEFREQVEDPLFGVSIYSTFGDHVLGFNNRLQGPSGSYEAGESVVWRFAFDNVLVPGRYEATTAMAHDGGGFHWIDYRTRWLDIVVTGNGGSTGALVELPFELTVSRRDGVLASQPPSA